MAFSIRLDPETEAVISRLARLSKRTKSAVVREAIASYQRAQVAARALPTTAFDAMAPFVGIVDSGGLQRSADTGQAFRTLLTEKARARRPR